MKGGPHASFAPLEHRFPAVQALELVVAPAGGPRAGSARDRGRSSSPVVTAWQVVGGVGDEALREPRLTDRDPR